MDIGPILERIQNLSNSEADSILKKVFTSDELLNFEYQNFADDEKVEFLRAQFLNDHVDMSKILSIVTGFPVKLTCAGDMAFGTADEEITVYNIIGTDKFFGWSTYYSSYNETDYSWGYVKEYKEEQKLVLLSV